MAANKLLFLISFLVFILMTSEGAPNACAACRYQRRRCKPDCIFRSYFPADKPTDFENVHRLFGIKRLENMLKNVDPASRDDAAKSIKFEADAWKRFPVNSPYEYIRRLQCLYNLKMNELLHIQKELALHKSAAFNPTGESCSSGFGASTSNHTDTFSGVAADGREGFLYGGGGYFGSFLQDPAGGITSSGFRASSSNLTDHFCGVPADGTEDFLYGGGGYFGSFAQDHAGGISSSGFRAASSSNLTDCFCGVPADGTEDFLGGNRGYFGSFAYETETMPPLELTDAQQPFPTSTDPSLRFLTATENANNGDNNENAIDRPSTKDLLSSFKNSDKSVTRKDDGNPFL